MVDYIHQGNLGKILSVYALNYYGREGIGNVDGPQRIPESVDYDLWCGPAPLKPLMRKKLHYDWRFIWDIGSGELGNMGAHHLDVCRWILRINEPPASVISIGARLGPPDDGQTPNTQLVFYDYKDVPIIYEIRGLPTKADGTKSRMLPYRGIRAGMVVQCEKGHFAGTEGGGWIYDNNGKKVKQFTGVGGRPAHHVNFIKAVRSRKVSDLHADIIEGHHSANLCHIANISHRIGTLAAPGQIRQRIKADSQASAAYNRLAEHLTANGIDLEKTRTVLGPALTLDPKTERFVGDTKYGPASWANEFLRRNDRKPFIVPEQV